MAAQRILHVLEEQSAGIVAGSVEGADMFFVDTLVKLESLDSGDGPLGHRRPAVRDVDSL